MATMRTIYAIVSFERTPLARIGGLANMISANGWVDYEQLPDRVIVKFQKDFPDGTHSSIAKQELRAIMGEHWVDLGAEPAA